ncbi:PAAR domain-containing protein [Pseudomonas guariconensis]|uniref:PAAR domain-containing protein n=1 Tax=Pseudomonas guariconensis TaxID=1288410 RepID=UPI0018A991C3|nr:PAAR domain-containing protein [Pseudomonas guariconensis]MBF8720068.1 PAAR domain-containing protein [Pseudomonas guariconensis]
MYRVSLEGKGQAVDGDITTTGAICIASGEGYICEGRKVLRVGDATTECPLCGEPGVVVEGYLGWISDGQPLAMDGALVQCRCPIGSNRVMAPLHGDVPYSHALDGATPIARSAPAVERAHAVSAAQAPASITFPQEALEPGFYIVPRSMSGPQLLAGLLEQDKTLPIARIQRLNPTFDQGFKAGEIFVIGDPDNHTACTREEADLMRAAEHARKSLGILSEEEANFMMVHIGEIAGILSGASTSMGVGRDMLEKGLGQVKDTLKGIEALHQRQFALHGHLRNPEFFASRQALYQQLSAQLSTSFLHKRLSLGTYDGLRRDLGISPKSLVHHWKKTGGPGQIPGYATHLDEVAKTARYLRYRGYVAIGLGATSSYLRVQEACRAGETEACKRIRFIETGSFSGGVIGGMLGAVAATKGAQAVCAFTPAGRAVCGIVLVGISSIAGSQVLEGAGRTTGELVFEQIYD